MKVTYKMIDKQLRMRGFLFNLMMSKSSEAKFVKFMHTLKRLTEKAKGRKIKERQRWLTFFSTSSITGTPIEPKLSSKICPARMLFL